MFIFICVKEGKSCLRSHYHSFFFIYVMAANQGVMLEDYLISNLNHETNKPHYEANQFSKNNYDVMINSS